MTSLALLALLLAAAAAPPASAPADREQRVTHLTRRGIDLLKQRNLPEAENALAQALDLAPTRYLALYNMACVQALLGRSTRAMDHLEQAVLNGFTDFIHIQKDPDLASLRTLDRYKALIARKDELQRRDADRVLAFLKSQLGQGYRFEVDPDHKLIFATNTDASTLAALKLSLIAQADSLYDQLFDNRPDQYIAIIVPSAADFRQIISRPGVGGFYDHQNRRLIAQRLGQVMTHEFTHALHNADLDPLAQEHPVWLSEGLATLFEPGRIENGQLLPADSFRLDAVQRAARTGRLIPLPRLLQMDQKAFTANAVVNLTYGQSGSLLLYLHELGLLRKFYETYKAGYDADKTGQSALEQVTGRKLPDLEADWRRWMLARTPPPATTGPNGPILGIRFAEFTDGLRVDYLLPNGPAHRAGVKTGDILVAIDDTDVRDYNTLIPLLAAREPGQSITLKLRRSRQYLTLPLTLAPRDSQTSQPSR